MATIQHGADAPVRLVHFTPANRSCWCWMFFRPVLSLSGLQPTIDGQVVNTGHGTTLSEHVRDTPSFATAQDADRWAEENGFVYDTAEVTV